MMTVTHQLLNFFCTCYFRESSHAGSAVGGNTASSSDSSETSVSKRKKKRKDLPVSPKVEVSKNKLVLQWAPPGSNSSSEGEMQTWKTRSMSRSSDSKSQVGDSNVTTTMGKIKVKTGGKKGKNVEEIMQDSLEEKDKEKWHYFGDKLSKKDSSVLKQLLLSKSDEDSESDSKKHPKCKREEESESDGVRTKVPRRSECTKSQR